MPLPIASSHWGGFSPSALFAHGEQGVWYDPTNLSTMFQDSAGTTPVTAVEQPVGKILDLSGRGNHATQSTSASRPVLSARVNLQTYSEQFNNAAWSKYNASVTADTTTAPDGTVTADTQFETIDNTFHLVYQVVSTTQSTKYTGSVCLKQKDRQWACVEIDSNNGATRYSVLVDLSNGNFVSAQSKNSPTGTSYSITSVGNGWYRISVTMDFTAVNMSFAIAPSNSATPTFSETFPVYAGDTSKGTYIWGADLRPANQGVNLPVYQRIATATSYDTAGFPLYLKFDGVDDSLATSAIDFTGTNKMSVFSGIRKQSDAAQGVVAELSATIASNNGSFLLTAPNSAAANYNFSSKGTTQVDNTVTTYTAPLSGVLSGLGDISAPSNIIRVNGSQTGSSTSSQGTGNYGNYALYIGRRASASLQWNGSIYGLIVRGASTSTPQLTATEDWMRLRSRAY